MFFWFSSFFCFISCFHPAISPRKLRLRKQYMSLVFCCVSCNGFACFLSWNLQYLLVVLFLGFVVTVVMFFCFCLVKQIDIFSEQVLFDNNKEMTSSVPVWDFLKFLVTSQLSVSKFPSDEAVSPCSLQISPWKGFLLMFLTLFKDCKWKWNAKWLNICFTTGCKYLRDLILDTKQRKLWKKRSP